MSLDPNYQSEDQLDIDDSDLSLTSFLRSCNRHVRETITITSTQNTDGIVQVEETLVSIRNGHVSIVQVKEKPFRIILVPAEYMKQVVKHEGEDKDFNSRSWVGATEYVKANDGIVSGCIRDIKTFFKNVKLEQVVAIIKSYSLNSLGDLKVTVRHLSGTLPGLIHYKKKNIVKLVKEEEMAYLELHVCGNVIDQEDLYKFDEEVLDLVLEEEARESRAHEEWLEKCMQQEEKDAEHDRQLLGFHGTI
nr:hypothetical protein [Tanacetum cinerariifolium]